MSRLELGADEVGKMSERGERKSKEEGHSGHETRMSAKEGARHKFRLCLQKLTGRPSATVQQVERIGFGPMAQSQV